MSSRPPKKNPYARAQTRTPEPAVRPAPVVAPPASPPAPPAPEANLVVESVPASTVATAVDTTVDTAVATTVAQPEHQIFRHLTAAQLDFCRTAQSKVGVPANILAALALLFLGVQAGAQAEEVWLLLNQNGYARGFTLTPRAAALQRMVERGL